MKKEARNIAASVRQRLLNRAKETHRPFENIDKRTQWKAFIRRSQLENAPQELKEFVLMLREFLIPVCKSVMDGKALGLWAAPGPWRD